MVLICALLTLLPGLARSDDTFRCGSYLVSTPLTVAELLQKCGQPSSKKSSTEDVRARVSGGGTQKIGTSATEVWRYDRPGSPPMIVTIVDGVIESLAAGEK
jgi:hypothetical protein